jgi:hypothetical protein
MSLNLRPWWMVEDGDESKALLLLQDLAESIRKGDHDQMNPDRWESMEEFDELMRAYSGSLRLAIAALKEIASRQQRE